MLIHNPSCKKCKTKVLKVLKSKYGEGVMLYPLNIPTQLKEYRGTPAYSYLKKIWRALTSYRGHNDLIRKCLVPPVDFFAPSGNRIIEFDELQHFTIPRRIALSLYPPGMKLGFNKKQWVRLCEDLNRHDNDPPHRDEQRAWLDTLRDFWPWLQGWPPIVRLYAKETAWCRQDENDSIWSNL